MSATVVGHRNRRPQNFLPVRYATHIARGDHQQELDEMIAAWTATVDYLSTIGWTGDGQDR